MILDARGRPLVFPDDDAKRRECLLDWYKALDLYPQEAIDGLLWGDVK